MQSEQNPQTQSDINKAQNFKFVWVDEMTQHVSWETLMTLYWKISNLSPVDLRKWKF